MNTPDALRDAIRNDADRRFGPDGWRTATTVYLLPNGDFETVKVSNRRDAAEGEVPKASPVVTS